MNIPVKSPENPAPDIGLRDHFLGWQCRLRQHAVRNYEGRPSAGMRPAVFAADGGPLSPALTMVLVETQPGETADRFRHIVRRTHDPAARRDEALRFLSSAYYQTPAKFSDVMTALLTVESELADALVAGTRCLLEFDQFSQGYRIPCDVAALAPGDPAYETTYWHNHMFNAAMPGVVRILAFTPDWRQATANPPV